MRETTSLGAAIAAGFSANVWTGFDELKDINRDDRTVFRPQISTEASNRMYQRWQRAVDMSRGWTDTEGQATP